MSSTLIRLCKAEHANCLCHSLKAVGVVAPWWKTQMEHITDEYTLAAANKVMSDLSIASHNFPVNPCDILDIWWVARDSNFRAHAFIGTAQLIRPRSSLTLLLAVTIRH